MKRNARTQKTRTDFMINRSFFSAGALFLTLLLTAPYGKALAAESLELRNLPTARPDPADEPAARSGSPAVHPALPSLPGEMTPASPPAQAVPSQLPSVLVPQERIVITEPLSPIPSDKKYEAGAHGAAPDFPEAVVPRVEEMPHREIPARDPSAPPSKPDPAPGSALVVPVPDKDKPEHAPEASPAVQTPVTLEQFLVKTPEKQIPQKESAAPKPAEKRQEARPKDVAPEPAEAKDKKTPAPKETKRETPPAKGQPLRIPEGAREKGDVSFLNGCWVGVRPEYHTKRMVREKFCFDENGTGKRFLSDPTYAGECVGATRALLNRNGVLHMRSDRMRCTNIRDLWGAAEMTCQGEGDQTPCTWIFRDAGGGRQSYKIRFVRE